MTKKLKRGCILCYAILFIALSPSMVFAQKDITGKVMDSERNIPLEGATIFENISKNSTVSARDGSFSLRTAANAKTITVSYTGYGTKTAAITGSVIMVNLEEDFSKLTEVVITV